MSEEEAKGVDELSPFLPTRIRCSLLLRASMQAVAAAGVVVMKIKLSVNARHKS